MMYRAGTIIPAVSLIACSVLASDLLVSPTNLTGSVSEGHRASGAVFQVSNTGTPPRTPIYYEITTNQAWIQLSPTNGSVADNTNAVNLTCLTETLASGWHTGRVTVTAAGIDTQTVTITMRVNSRPVLAWDASTRVWTNSILAGSNIIAGSVLVWNNSTNTKPFGQLNYAANLAGGAQNWAVLTAASGSSTSEQHAVTIQYNTAGLAAGIYTGELVLAGTDATTGEPAANSPLRVGLRAQIIARAELQTDLDRITGEVSQGYNQTNRLQIWNGSAAPCDAFAYTATIAGDLSGWVQATPASGTINNQTVNMSVIWNSAAKAPGTYRGSLIIDALDVLSGARTKGAPKIIALELNVLSRMPVNLEPPKISGKLLIGQTITGDNGLWTKADRLTFSGRWERVSNTNGSGVVRLAEGTGVNYVVRTADRGKYMRYIIKATDPYPTPVSREVASDLTVRVKVHAPGGDFNGDGVTDLWFFDESEGKWHAHFGNLQFAEGLFGGMNMTPVPADFDGDGYIDLGLYERNRGIWHILFLPRGEYAYGTLFGGSEAEASATPVTGDWDGDGMTDVGLYWRGYWALRYSQNGQIAILDPLGSGQGLPVIGDWDGDGISNIGEYENGVWTLQKKSGKITEIFGGTGMPAIGDFDGDGVADLCLYDRARNEWRMRLSSNDTIVRKSFGNRGTWVWPAVGYYDRDRFEDLATIRLSTNQDFVVWEILRSTETNFPYRGQSYQRSTGCWRVSW